MSLYLDNLEKQADQLFARVNGWETNALRRIGHRIKNIGSLSYADIKAINNAAIVNQDVEAIMKELAEITGQNVRDVQEMYNDMISTMHEDKKAMYDYRNKPFVPFADNKELQAITKAFARTTAETFVNLSMTKAQRIGFVDANGVFNPMDKTFTDVIDKAVMSVSTGTGDYNSEMLDVVRQLGGSGVRVDYGNGITRSIESMVRQNVLWGAKQTAKEYEHIIGDELGCDGIEIDWHSNPRPSHEFMQGKQYTLGEARTINGIYFESADDALAALDDYGCLHFETRIICGVSEPALSSEEIKKLDAENKHPIEIDGITKTGYEWKQTMRRLERAGRQTKLQRETFKAAGNNNEAKNQAEKLKSIQEKYQLIAAKTGIKAQPEKMAVIKSAKTVDKYSKSGIMKLSDNSDLNLKQYNIKSDIESVKKAESRIRADFNISVINIEALKNDEVLTEFLNETAILQNKYTERYNAIIADVSMIGTRDIAWVTPSRELYINPYFFNSKEAMEDILNEFLKEKTIPKKCANIQYVSKHEYYHLITNFDIDNPKSLVHTLFRRTEPGDFVSKNSMIDPYEFAADYLSIPGDNKIKEKLKKYYGLE